MHYPSSMNSSFLPGLASNSSETDPISSRPYRLEQHPRTGFRFGAMRSNIFSVATEVEVQDVSKKWLMHAKDRDR
ncbi:hypothetical protein AVEN_150149-1 [Araneus ventricosus]|uniref:Uncharacterized protein n=1 Tax=Araneus ventricosus TaxID=182803 RepID=A0A4Y2WNM4_ARAVE|nr:hypothetical protein AVEN_150149-1 [Araneus ventricosus]